MGAWGDERHMHLYINTNSNSLESTDRALFVLRWKGPIPKAEGAFRVDT
jgi:hypothetical protein